MSSEPQSRIDTHNAAFWDELCGSSFARAIGVTDASVESLRRFDRAYFSSYPYLVGHLAPVVQRQGRTLEIGLGYGTVSGYLAESGVDYHGLDIARGPVEMVRERLGRLGKSTAAEQVKQGSALEIPWPDEHLDAFVSIGCLHHTGNLTRAIGEVRRVLAPGGVAVIMIYNRNSLRQLLAVRPRAMLERLRGGEDEAARAAYDANAAGEAAPFTEFTSPREARALFAGFREVHIAKENMDGAPRLGLSREQLLGWPAHLLGLDLYITAIK
jgi:SAM-dependent methyltransferase